MSDRDKLTSKGSGRFLMGVRQHRQRAAQLRRGDPASRAAQLHDLAATAMERRTTAPNSKSPEAGVSSTLRNAAEPGDAQAQFELAEAYHEGDGVPRNDSMAVRWWRAAAEQGCTAAQYKLGCAYSNGEGVPKDFVIAYMWFKLEWECTSNVGPRVLYNPAADQQLETLEGFMNSAELHEAQRLVENWKDNHAPKTCELERPNGAALRGPTVIGQPETRLGQAKSPKSSAGYIYILKPRISINGQEVIKIGMTTRTVAERVRELTTGSMVSFEVVYSLRIENARNFEKYLHARYRDRRLIAGGGQEFFTVPAQEVVAEVERRATEISRARAQAARNGEMAAFLVRIGAARVEGRISGRLGWLWFACWLGGTFCVNRLAHSIVGEGAVFWLTALSAVVVLPVILSVAYERLKRHFMAIYYEPNFRSAIDAKHQELRQKYPLAYA
jgi:hypothetical protein